MELAIFFSMPRASRSLFRHNRSSPTSWIRLPSLSVISFQAVPVVLRKAVFDADDRVFFTQLHVHFGELGGRVQLLVPSVLAVFVELACSGIERDADVSPACSLRLRPASKIRWIAASFEGNRGANPPSSPTDVVMPSFFRIAFKLWKISVPQRSASAKLSKPYGHDHELLHSRPLSACMPPFTMFISGVAGHELHPPR